MPLFMDVHEHLPEGATAADVADAHAADSAARVHRQAHGLVADRIVPVKEGA